MFSGTAPTSARRAREKCHSRKRWFIITGTGTGAGAGNNREDRAEEVRLVPDL